METLNDDEIKRFMMELQKTDRKIHKEPHYGVFQISNYSGSEKPENAQPNDLHPDLIRYAASVAYVFKNIEAPSEGFAAVAGVAETYGKKIEKILETMEHETGYLGREDMNFSDSFVQEYSPSSSKVLHLVNGLGAGKFFNSATQRTAYQKAIYYLHYFIALLDLNNGVRGSDVINFLMKNDSLQFCDLVGKIAKDMYNENAYGDIKGIAGTRTVAGKDIPSQLRTERVIESIKVGLASVADSIINKFRAGSTFNPADNARKTITAKIDGLGAAGARANDFKWDTKANVLAMLAELGVQPAILTNGFRDAFVKLDKLVTDNTNTDLVKINTKLPSPGLTVADLKRYRMNGFLNWNRLTKGETKVNHADMESISCKAPSGVGMGGSLAAWKAKAAAAYLVNPSPHATIKALQDAEALRFGRPPTTETEWETAYATVEAMPTGATAYPNAKFLYSPATTEANSPHYRIDQDIGGVGSSILNPAAPLNEFGNVWTEINNFNPSTATEAQWFALAALLGLLYKVADSDMNAGADVSAQAAILKNAMKESVNNFAKVYPRINYIQKQLGAGNDKAIFDSDKQLSQSFAEGFMYSFKEQILGEAGKYRTAKKGRRPLSEMKTAYEYMNEDDNVDFFKKIFNLVKIDNDGKMTTTADFDAAMKDKKFSEYSLNIRKRTERPTLIQDLQVGGDNGYTNDPMFFTVLFPAINMDNFGDIWITMSNRIRHRAIRDSLFIQNRILRPLYYTASPTQPIDIEGISITVPGLFTRFRSNGFSIGAVISPDRANQWIKLGRRGMLEVEGGWEEVNKHLTEKLMNLDEKWYREGDSFYYRDSKTGKNIGNPNPSKSCAFVDHKCDEFMDCVRYGRKAECIKFLTDETYAPETIDGTKLDSIIEKVKGINPAAAALFLKSLYFRVNEKSANLRNRPSKQFIRYEVESVGSWLKNLPNLETKFGANYAAIKARFELDADKKIKGEKVLRYLDVLVAWVNANPQILNQEETLDNIPDMDRAEPVKMKIFKYEPVPRTYKSRVQSICTGLSRLNAGIDNETAGWSGRSLLSNIYSTPMLNMPLMPSVLVSKKPRELKVFQLGGGHEFMRSLEEHSKAFGSGMYDGIFKELLSIMDAYRYAKANAEHCGDNASCRFKIALKKESEQQIKTKLDKLKEAEEAIRKKVADIIQDKKLLVASHGQLDRRQVDFGHPEDAIKDELKDAVLKKHADLLSLTGAYNRRATEMGNTLQVISNMILDKMEASKPKGTGGDNYLDQYI